MERLEENRPVMEGTSKGKEKFYQLTQGELRQIMEEAGKNAIMAYERRNALPIENETIRRRMVHEREVERVYESMSRRDLEVRHRIAPSKVGSSAQSKGHRREPAISRAEVDSVGKQIQMLGKQIDELKQMG
ncbi:UNVERIFIED_CONTAM: hypothetical protein Sindi_1845100 [Sesamum indicum]